MPQSKFKKKYKKRHKPRHATTSSRSVDMIFCNYNPNPVSDFRPRY
jgi:hypothetical protein